MILINFSHPLTAAQLAEIEALTGQPVTRLVDLVVQFDNSRPFPEQFQALMSGLSISAAELQTEPVLVNLPALNSIAALTLAELHGRMGYFPAVLRLRPTGDLPPRYEVAEILNLNKLREEARTRRHASAN